MDWENKICTHMTITQFVYKASDLFFHDNIFALEGIATIKMSDFVCLFFHKFRHFFKKCYFRRALKSAALQEI